MGGIFGLFGKKAAKQPKQEKPSLSVDDLKAQLSSLDCLLNERLLDSANAEDERTKNTKGPSDSEAKKKYSGTSYMMSEQLGDKLSSKYLVFGISLASRDSGAPILTELYIRGFEKKYEHHPQIAADFLREISIALGKDEISPEWPMDGEKYVRSIPIHYADITLTIQSGGGGEYFFDKDGLTVAKTNQEFGGVLHKLTPTVETMINTLRQRREYSNIKVRKVVFY